MGQLSFVTDGTVRFCILQGVQRKLMFMALKTVDVM